jgi:hypothetical protein
MNKGLNPINIVKTKQPPPPRPDDVVENGYLDGEFRNLKGTLVETISSAKGVGGNIYRYVEPGKTERITIRNDGKGNYYEVVSITVDKMENGLKTNNVTEYYRPLTGQVATYTFTYSNGYEETMTVLTGSETARNYWSNYFSGKLDYLPSMNTEGEYVLNDGKTVKISYTTSDNRTIEGVKDRGNCSSTYNDLTIEHSYNHVSIPLWLSQDIVGGRLCIINIDFDHLMPSGINIEFMPDMNRNDSILNIVDGKSPIIPGKSR